LRYPDLRNYLRRIADSRHSANSKGETGRGGDDGDDDFFFDVFLAHTWMEDSLGRDNHARVGMINTALKEAGLRTWFDEDRMVGDINLQMADGIDRSNVVLVFLTPSYMVKANGDGPNGENDNVRFEFNYSLLKKGVEYMIPVVMDPHLKDTRTWSGVVGGKLGTRMYVDCSDDYADGNMSELANKIVQLLGSQRAVQVASAAQAAKSRVAELAAAEDASIRTSGSFHTAQAPATAQGSEGGSGPAARTNRRSFTSVVNVASFTSKLSNSTRRVSAESSATLPPMRSRCSQEGSVSIAASRLEGVARRSLRKPSGEIPVVTPSTTSAS